MYGKNLSSIHLLLSDVLRFPIERKVSEHLGRPWRVKMTQDRNHRASHPAAILSDGVFPVLAKLGVKSVEDQFAREIVGLELIAKRSRVLTPAVIANLKVENGTIMILEALARGGGKEIA